MSMFSNAGTRCWIVLIAWISVLGCATATTFYVTDPISVPDAIQADSYVQVRRLKLTGKLMRRPEELYPAFLGGLSVVGPAIKGKTEEEYTDGILDVTIDARHSTRKGDEIKYYAGIGAMVYNLSGNSLTFEWAADVHFVLLDWDGNTVVDGEFEIRGQDSQVTSLLPKSFGGQYDTAWKSSLRYPDEEKRISISDQILTLAGQEVGKRLRVGSARAYFIARTQARDGMDPRTYAKFLATKDRIKREPLKRASSTGSQITAMIADPNSAFDMGRANVMVFGIGVDNYENFPPLHLAARDCRRVVGWFKSRYGLPDDRASCLVDEEASAIKVARFLTRSAGQLLDHDNTFVFYFSGHGAPEPTPSSTDGDGLQKYLLLADTEPDAMTLTAINLNDLFALLEQLPAKRKIVFLDTCFVGEAGRDVLAELKGVRVSAMTYHNLASIGGSGTIILAASSENQVSQERGALGSGLFTYYLIDGLEGAADQNKDDKVDLLELFTFVADRVESASQGQQTPVLRGELERNIQF